MLKNNSLRKMKKELPQNFYFVILLIVNLTLNYFIQQIILV